jgi:hypothetical protein
MSKVVKSVGKAVSGVAKGVVNVVKKVAPIAAPVLAIAAPGIGTAIGGFLGATGTAATVLGGGVIGAAGSAIGGQNALTGGLLGAGGAYLGSLLSPASTAGSAFGSTAADSAFIAADAAQLAGQGLGQAAIEQNLLGAGVDAFIAADAAQLAAQGLGASSIAQSIGQSAAAAGKPSLFSNILNKGSQILGGLPQQQQLLGQAGLFGGAAGGAGGLSSVLNSLLNAGIDYETAKKIADQARAEGKSITDKAQEIGQQGMLPQSVLDNLNNLATSTAQQFREAGAAAQVPFTPYTVTTGAGTATMGPGQATATAAGPYAQIQQQAQQQAFNTLTAMNPAQASQTLFDQMQALTQPAQQRQQQQLLGTLGQRGLLGFGQNMPTVGGATRTVNPLLESLLSAQGTERAQQGLQATQFGTSEAQRQAALSQALTAQAQGIDQQTLGLLGQAGQFGLAEQALAQANAARQFQATTAGLGLPLSTGLATAGMQQRGLEFGASAGLRGQQAAIPLQLQAGLIEAGRTQNLADLSRSAINELFR